MENVDDVSSSGRVTRSLRKRLTSIDSEQSSSRPTTPLATKLSSIVELNSPSCPVRMTRRNSISGQATPSKTPLKGRTVGLRSEVSLALNSPKRSTRKRSSSLTEDEPATGVKITQPKFDTLPEEDDKSATPSKSTSLHEKSVRRGRGRPSIGAAKPGPKSRTRQRLQSDSDIETINLEDEEEEEKKENDTSHETRSKLNEKRLSVGGNKIIETINLVNDTLLLEEIEVMGEKAGLKAKQVINKEGDILNPNDESADEQQQANTKVPKFSNYSALSTLSSTTTKIIITKVETLKSLSPDKICKYIKGDSFENSSPKKNNSKSVAFNDSEYDNSMKATYPRTPGHTRTKSYIEVDSSKDTIEDKSFQIDKGSGESFKDAEMLNDTKNAEKTREANASKESVEFFDASNVVGEEEIGMEVGNNNLLILDKTPHKSKMLKNMQSSTPVVETMKGDLELKHMSQKQSEDVDEANDTSNVEHHELDTSLEKSLRSGKRYGSVSPSLAQSPSSKKSHDMESLKITSKDTEGMKSPKSSPKNPSKEAEGFISPQLSPINSSKKVEGMQSPKHSPKKISEEFSLTSPKSSPQNSSNKEAGITSKSSPKNLSTVGVTLQRLSPKKSSEEVGKPSPKPTQKNLSKEEVDMTSHKPSPKNPFKEEISMSTPKPSSKNPSKEEASMTTPNLSSKNPSIEEIDVKSPKNTSQKLNISENVNISKAEHDVNCNEKTGTKSPCKGDGMILNASNSVTLIIDDAVAETAVEKNTSTILFSKSWSQGVSGTVNTSTKIDAIAAITETITTETDSKLEKKNTSMRRRLRIESQDEMYDVGDNVENIENEEEEEDLCERNDFVDNEAEEADENYCSGDSMSQDERQEIEDNMIPINDAESIGSKDTEEDEYDEEEAEKDSFIATDEEFQLEYSDDNKSIEGDDTKQNSYKRIILQSSSDESGSEECAQEAKTNGIDNESDESFEDNDVSNVSVNNFENFDELNEPKKSKRRSSIKPVNGAENDGSLSQSINENADLTESIKASVDEVEHDESFNNSNLNESKKSKRKSSMKTLVDEVEHDEGFNKSANENAELNESKESKRRSSIKAPVDEVEQDESFNNSNLNESKKSKCKSSMKTLVDEVEHDEGFNKSANENADLNESKKSKRRSSIKAPVDEVEQDESSYNSNLNESKKSKRKSSMKTLADEVEHDEGFNKSANENADLNESKKSKRRSSIKAPVDEVEQDESSYNCNLNESKKSKRKSSMKTLADEVEHDEGFNKSANENADLNESKKSKRRSSIKPPVDNAELDESLNKSTTETNLNESKKSKRKSSIKPPVSSTVELDKSLNKSTNETNLNDSKKSKRISSVKSVVTEVEHDESLNKSKAIKSRSAINPPVDEDEQDVEKYSFELTKRKSLERRKSISQLKNEEIVTSGSDDAEEDQNLSGMFHVRRAPISQSLEMQREQEYESSSSDTLSRSKLYDNESSDDSKIEKQKSLNVSKTQLKCAKRNSLENQKSKLESIVRSRKNFDGDDGGEIEKDIELCESRANKARKCNEWKKQLGKSLNKSQSEIDALLNNSQKISDNKNIVTSSERESRDTDTEEEDDHFTSSKAKINVSKQKCNKSLNGSKKLNYNSKVVSPSESESEDDNDNIANKSSLQRSHAIHNCDSDSDSSPVAESDKNDLDEKTCVATQQSSSICANEKSKHKYLKSSGLSVSFGQIKEKKKTTAGGEITHSSFTIGVSVTKNGESDEYVKSSEKQDVTDNLGKSDTSNYFLECEAKAGVSSANFNDYYKNSTPYGFTLPKGRFLSDEPEKLAGEIDSKLFEDANRAALEKKINDNNSKLKLHSKKEKLKSKHLNEEEFNEIFVPLVSNKDQKHKEKVKLALEQALKASADIILNEPGKKKPKHLQKIDEDKIQTKRLPEEILEAVAEAEQKVLKNENNEPLSRLPPNDNEKTLSHRRHVIKTNSGDITESPLTPPPSLKRKRSKMNKFELTTGVVWEEPVTPKKEKIKSGFRESPITPRTTGFKVRKLLAATEPIQQAEVRKNRKRTRSNDELKYTLPKPKWTQSGMFMEEELPSIHSIARTGATQFLVSSLHGARKTTKRPATSSTGPTLITSLGTAGENALNFKNSTMFRDNIPRESSQQMLQRKERHRMHNQF